MVQARYGWTDDYIMYGVSYSRLLDIAQIIAEAKEEEQQQELRNIAFGSWQNYLTIVTSLGGKKAKPKSFRQWVRDFGLMPKQKKLTAEQKETFAAKAVEMANQALKEFGEVKKSGNQS